MYNSVVQFPSVDFALQNEMKFFTSSICYTLLSFIIKINSL